MSERHITRKEQGWCPNCGSDNTRMFDTDSEPLMRYEFFECLDCGQEFSEVYRYDHTYWMEARCR